MKFLSRGPKKPRSASQTHRILHGKLKTCESHRVSEYNNLTSCSFLLNTRFPVLKKPTDPRFPLLPPFLLLPLVQKPLPLITECRSSVSARRVVNILSSCSPVFCQFNLQDLNSPKEEGKSFQLSRTKFHFIISSLSISVSPKDRNFLEQYH